MQDTDSEDKARQQSPIWSKYWYRPFHGMLIIGYKYQARD